MVAFCGSCRSCPAGSVLWAGKAQQQTSPRGHLPVPPRPRACGAVTRQPSVGVTYFYYFIASFTKVSKGQLGKLTMASKVYRGIAGMTLPKEFWEANDFGVRGGVENAFM